MQKKFHAQLTKQLGKIAYISSTDIQEQLNEKRFTHIAVALFCLFGSFISLFMFYGVWQQHSWWYALFGVMFGWFIPAFFMNFRSFFEATVIAVGDKGVGRYTVSKKGILQKEELLHFTPQMQCILKEGYVDPHSPVSKKGYKYEAIWMENNKHCFSIAYLQEDVNTRFNDKKAMEEALKAFQLYQLRTR